LKPKYRRDRLITTAVMDASPLFASLILELADKSPESHRNAILGQSALPEFLMGNPTRQENFVRLLRSIPNLLTTSHVIAEVNGLLKREHIRGERYRAFWTCGMDLLNARALDERSLLRLLDMYVVSELKEGVCTLGPVDTALIDLTRSEGATLLTDDSTLAGRAWEIGVDCRLTSTLISM